jgi:hypothetical protein
MRSLICGLLALTVLACDKTYITVPTAPGQLPAGTGTTPRHVIQFRVIGNASSARVRFSTPADGLDQVITTLPYFNGFTTTNTSVFLSLEVTPAGYPMLTLYPFLAAQIVVDDALFREATAADLSLGTLAVNGTWRQ